MNRPLPPGDENRIYARIRDHAPETPDDDYRAWLAEDARREEKDAFVRNLWHDPAFNDALHRIEDNAPHRSHFRPYLVRPAWMAVAASVVLATILLTTLLGSSESTQPGPQVYQTAVKQVRHQTLADGSMAELNAQTRVTVHYSSEARQIQLLEGEARFSVTKDARRPFTVETRQARMQALGTVFNVDQRGPVTELSVYEGRVAITPMGDSRERRVLTAGERLAVTSEGLQTLSSFDPAQDKHWLNGWISVEAMPLSQLLIKLNRFAPTPIQAEDHRTGDLLVTGDFDLNQPDKNLQILATLHNLDIQRGADSVILRQP